MHMVIILVTVIAVVGMHVDLVDTAGFKTVEFGIYQPTEHGTGDVVILTAGAKLLARVPRGLPRLLGTPAESTFHNVAYSTYRLDIARRTG